MQAIRQLACLCLAGLLLPAFAQSTETVPFISSPDDVTLEMLRIAGGSGLLALPRGQSFTRSPDGSCGA